MDFAVDRWADKEKTRPLTFRPKCRTCNGRVERKRYFSQPLEERTKADRARRDRLNPNRRRHRQRVEHDKAVRVEQRTVNRVLGRMSKANRILYEMEGTLPLVESIASEDYDLTPVPQGCASCYLHGGNVCITCPDSDVKARRKEARKQGRIVGVPFSAELLVS